MGYGFQKITVFLPRKKIKKNKEKEEMAFVILKDRPYRLGKTRSEQEENLRKEDMKTMSDSQLDKLKFVEKKHGNSKSFFDKHEIDKAK